MFKRFFAFTALAAIFATLSLGLTACSSASPAQSAGAALADITCLGLSNPSALTDMSITDEIAKSHGFEDGVALDLFMVAAQGTEDINQVSASLRTAIEETCPDEMAAVGITAADIAESIVFDQF